MKIPILALALLLMICSPLLAGQSADYKSWPEVLDGGGGKVACTAYIGKASIIQRAIGPSTSQDYIFKAGFLYCSIMYQSPQGDKNSAIARLNAVKLLLPAPERSKIDAVIASIQQSLNPLWWVDQWHLNQQKEAFNVLSGPSAKGLVGRGDGGGVLLGFEAYPVPTEKKRYGQYVFERERDAASKIKLLLKNTWYPQLVLQALSASAWDMLHADSTIAQTKIGEAELSGGDPWELQQARYAMQIAEMLKKSAKQYYDVIISYYGSAWLHAVYAEEKGLTTGNIQIARIDASAPVFALGKPYPNPSRSDASIRYGVAYECLVSLKIYDISGRLVRTLKDERTAAGYYLCEWDSRDDSGVPVASGTYVYRLAAGPFVAANKLVMVK
jgi:hypothetical protein